MIRLELGGGWHVRGTAGPIPADLPASVPATVPGCIHTDLLAAGLIDDPYLDDNESRLQWIGRSDFTYATTFDASMVADCERVELVCDGLDTIAAVSLNGVELGQTRNQHRSYRFDVRDSVRATGNELEVSFASALEFAQTAQRRLGPKPFVGNSHPYNAIRKMASNFGWDWGPVLVTCGIWKPVQLVGWSGARLGSVTPLATVTPGGNGLVSISVVTDRTHTRPLRLRARVQGHGTVARIETALEGTTETITLEVDEPDLWWPRGYGDQPLYELTVDLLEDDELLDTFQREIGFRTVEVREQPDEFGTDFAFVINGQRILVKGANWIPDDCFVSRVSRDEYEHGVRDATEAGFNLLRIWGGGIFESDELYSLCDRAGVMVWQDFLFACAAYSEADELWREVEAETRENVIRLAPHPSLVFYNGSNENVEGFYDWGWKQQMAPGEPWGSGYYDRLFPQILAELDPTRPYRPSSPYSPVDVAHPQDVNSGTVHSWEVWNRQDYGAYAASVPRFVSEFGFQGPPNYATLRRSIHDDPLTPESIGMLWHQKAEDGNEKLARGYQRHLPEPTTFDDWHFTAQLNQARAVRFGVEHFRSHYPRTTGSIVWQLNDCWPVTSWAAVDGDRRRKPLWYALRALNADRLLTIQPRDGELALIASNDTGERWTETLLVRRRSLSGVELASQRIDVDIPPRSNATAALNARVTMTTDAESEVITAESEFARRALWYFVPDLNLSLPAFSARWQVQRIPTGYEIRVTADSFIKDLTFNPDRLDASASVSDMMLTLLPGEEVVLTVTCDSDLDEQALVAHPVLQSVNHLVEHSMSLMRVP